MNNKFVRIFWFLISLSVTTQAKATEIFSTGPGSDQGGFGGGSSLNSNQWARVQFSIAEDTTITDIFGFLGSFSGGDFTFAIYDDSVSGFNSVGTELFSSVTSIAPNSPNNWIGLTGVNWNILSGTYWASFEVRSGQTFSGWHRGWNPPTPTTPLPALSYNFSNHSNWQHSSYWYGLKIESNSVPEPTMLVLLGLGLAGLTLRKHSLL